MTGWLIKLALGELWSIVWQMGVVALVLIGALAWAWFMPLWRKTALMVALAAGFILCTAGYFTKLGADYVQAKWDAAVVSAIKEGEDARKDAERDTAAEPDDRLRHDPHNRDRS